MIVIKDGKLTKGTAKEFEPEIEELFNLSILCHSRTPEDFTCAMQIDDETQLKAPLVPDVDEAEHDSSIYSNRYYSLSTTWLFEGEEYTVFIKPDIKELSKFNFAFYTSKLEVPID